MEKFLVERMRHHPQSFFVPQVEPAEQVQDLISNWPQLDKNLPETNWCGLCCVRMIALSCSLNPPRLQQMHETAFHDYQVFRLQDDRLVGAYHKELADYIRGEFSLDAEASRNLSVSDVASLVIENNFVIASVTPEIRELESTNPKSKNGHFVLIFGVCNMEGKTVFIIHNSAGFTQTNTQVNVHVTEDRFQACFSGNAIIIAGG